LQVKKVKEMILCVFIIEGLAVKRQYVMISGTKIIEKALQTCPGFECTLGFVFLKSATISLKQRL